MYKLGIVGNGFVGSSVAFGFSPQCGCDGIEMRIYDKDDTKSLNTLEDLQKQDYNGDLSINMRTLPILLGPTKMRYLIIIWINVVRLLGSFGFFPFVIPI